MATRDKTLKEIFAKPTRADLRWDAAVGLVKKLGGTVTQRAGSRVAFDLGHLTIVLHEPHPGDIMKKYAVESLRDFLMAAGYGHPKSAATAKIATETTNEEDV
jgi:hypothetical protein